MTRHLQLMATDELCIIICTNRWNIIIATYQVWDWNWGSLLHWEEIRK